MSTFNEADYAEQQDTYILDWYYYCHELLSYMNRQPNFTSEMGFDLNDFSFGTDGKLREVLISEESKPTERRPIACDKVVLALGSNLAPIVQKTLNVNIPIVGIKGYSFDLIAKKDPKDLPACNAILFIMGKEVQGSHEVFNVTT